eukprot:scaffold129_cov254-Pinguiococcus_pyrenoidosus.AAC.13
MHPAQTLPGAGAPAIGKARTQALPQRRPRSLLGPFGRLAACLSRVQEVPQRSLRPCAVLQQLLQGDPALASQAAPDMKEARGPRLTGGRLPQHDVVKNVQNQLANLHLRIREAAEDHLRHPAQLLLHVCVHGLGEEVLDVRPRNRAWAPWRRIGAGALGTVAAAGARASP